MDFKIKCHLFTLKGPLILDVFWIHETFWPPENWNISGWPKNKQRLNIYVAAAPIYLAEAIKCAKTIQSENFK